MEKQLRQKAERLTAKLTLEEKISMIHGAELFRTAGVERLGIPPLTMSDGPMGVRQEFPGDSWVPCGLSNDYVTYLPCNSALAATWNRKLAYEMGSVLGEEARGRGKDVILAPGINIKRSPLCGRNFEYFSEDPYLTAELAVPYVKGVQNWDVAACVKHFAANNQETERLWMEVEVDEEALRTIYLPAFHEALMRGGAYSVMGAYNKLYGEYGCQSRFLLGQVLRKEWGYDGVVISDWGGVHDTEAAARSQLDIEMSVTCDFDRYCMAHPLKEKVEQGEIEERLIDEKVTYILMLMMRLHMLDGRRKSGTYNTEEHRRSALRIARESVVLLKNEKHRLPLSKENTHRILVIGDNAESIHSNGGGSAEIKALYEISPLLGIQMVLGGNGQVTFARGYCRDEEDAEAEAGEVSWQASSLEHGGGTCGERRDEGVGAAEPGTGAVGTEACSDRGDDVASVRRERSARLRREAVSLAESDSFDAVIFVGGLNHHQDCEGHDRPDMKLPYEQDQLIRELLAVRSDTVVVLTGGSPVEMESWIDQTDTLVWGWYAGMEGGRALAEVLFGEVNPSGKLPETFYKKHMDCSAHCWGEFAGKETVRYREGVFVGYRYNDAFGVEPQFCFGHGLSYTEFAYANLHMQQEKSEEGVVWYAVCEITNQGQAAGAEIVQVYLAPRRRSTNRPVQELRGFAKVMLKPQETKTVRIRVEGYEDGMDVRVGSSSRDIRLFG